MSEVTGEQLHNELCAAASAAGKSVGTFVAPLFKGASWKLEQLRIARKPTPVTIDRVRALIAGEPLPPTRAGRYERDARAFGLSRTEAEDAGIPPSARSVTEGRSLDQQCEARERMDWLLELSERARMTRRPGQTVHERYKELRAERH